MNTASMKRTAWGLKLLRGGSVLLPLVGAMLWGVVVYFDEQKRAIEQAYENTALVRQYAQRLIETQKLSHDAARVHVAAQDQGYLRSEAFHSFLKGIEASQGSSYGVVVAQLDGSIVASSRGYPVSASFGQREYLAAIGNGSSLFLDRMILVPGGQDALVVAEEFTHAGFRGAIVSAVPVEAIRDFLQSVARRPGEAASLLRGDGKLLVRNIPSDPSQLRPSTPARVAIQNAPQGHYRAVAASDGVSRIYAYSEMPMLSVYATFGVPTAAIWTGALRRSVPVWLLLALGGAFFWMLAGFIRKGFDERLALEEQARLRLLAEQKAAQQEGFMRELNHRVKNNLALVDGLIGFQMRRQGGVDPEVLRTRIRAIGDVHDLLYRAADAYQVDVGALIRQLCANPAIVPQERGIRVNCNAEQGIVVDARTATSVALVVVELVTNAVKHAFVGRAGGAINVVATRQGSDVCLSVSDDGIGFPETTTRTSGTRIVKALVDQVGGEWTRTSDNGTVYRITFPHTASSAESR